MSAGADLFFSFPVVPYVGPIKSVSAPVSDCKCKLCVFPRGKFVAVVAAAVVVVRRVVGNETAGGECENLFIRVCAPAVSLWPPRPPPSLPSALWLETERRGVK
jgi:hypothetical protein